MLLKIRDYLRRERIASNQQIAREFCIDIPALQPILDIWLRKGVIGPCQQETACQTRCFSCKTLPLYYQYLER